MLKYEIKDVVCDYGIFENDELKLILNDRRNAELILKILELDMNKSVDYNSLFNKAEMLLNSSTERRFEEK